MNVLVRDRSEADAEAARIGAPEALQVADRFHLLQNLAEVLTDGFRAHASRFARIHAQGLAVPTRCTTPPPLPPAPSPSSVPLAPPQSSTAAARLARQRRTHRWAHYHQGWTDHQQGWTLDAIAARVGISRRMVQRYLQSPTFPERQPMYARDRSLLDPYKTVLLAGWNSGCRHGRHRFRMIRHQGFCGVRGSCPRI